jgi:hypothetical protein
MKDSVKSLAARDSIFAAAVVENAARLIHNWVVAVRASSTASGNNGMPLSPLRVVFGAGCL